MKLAVVVVLALASLAHSRSVDYVDVLNEITSYGYLEKYGKPRLEEIRIAEESERNGARIVGGSTSSVGQFPYQAGLVIHFAAGQAVCGGSLVSRNRVVTAAHCWWDGQSQARLFTVVLGSVFIFSGGSRQDSRDVVMHGSWMPALARNDIAVIRLGSSVTLSNTINIIALPSGTQLNENFAGSTAVASGFGRTSDGSGIASNQRLSHVNLPVITNAVCANTYGSLIQASNICTSGANGRSTCQGDSGGPLAITRNNQPLLIGVTSFGHRDGCQRGHPAAFARVTTYNTFIRNLL